MESMVINILDIISYYIVLLDFVFVFVIDYKYKYKVQYKSHESNKYKGRRCVLKGCVWCRKCKAAGLSVSPFAKGADNSKTGF